MKYIDLIKYLEGKIKKGKNITEKQLIVNEELQKIVLFSVNHSKEKDLFFLGGTNLRLCYNLDRYSEDLDFSYHGKNIDLEAFGENIENTFRKLDLGVNLKWNTNTNVKKSYLKIPQIYFDLGLSKMKSEVASIKIEIDVHPPTGNRNGSKVLQSFFGAYVVKNYDIETTFSGKIGAVLLRPYSKGRDYYDLLWYFQNIEKKFNLLFLVNTIKQYNLQSEKKIKVPSDHKEVLNMILDNIERIKITDLRDDISRFSNYSGDVVESYLENYKTDLLCSMKKYLENIERGESLFRF